MLRSIVIFAINIGVLSFGSVFGQGAASPASSSGLPAIEAILEKASHRRHEYVEAFKELHAGETQTTEDYDDKGLKKRREIVSDLIIYQSPLDESVVVEYRNVRSVDGKPVSNRDDRAEQLFARIGKAKSLKEELGRIDRESRRHDLNSSFSGYTLHQAMPLKESLRRHFRFTLIGTERVDGHEVIAIAYQQISQIPGATNQLKLPKKLAGAMPLERGRLYLDRDTLRLRREEREMTINHPSLKDPLIFVKAELNYAESPFGILTPTHVVMTTFTRGRDRADGTPELLIGGKVTSIYGPFRRFEVTPDFQPNQANRTQLK